ncbi:anaerobic coproporphyrinogen III oxidase [Sinobacterium caligoides]|uniref:Heme chaperone HemW n=1 Tax=Sinobacterium caligoides TaxID=933926 RepID=A0A3N2DGL1_9GAMM|nr:radical SAM family heme chaperone HemW [Sinobacterium caligoides]ROR98936.1 anaerobic coproporphyrinogen III oxidase [Sinobacterium caligoides]
MLLPPLSLYIHIPWCVRKCPYCDFNSHQQVGEIPETDYIDALIDDLKEESQHSQGRKIHSIFIGGGTPSLLGASAYARLLEAIEQQIGIEQGAEITLEANPGSVEQSKFTDYRHAGINRLSIGVQSFQEEQLQALGRIHNGHEAAIAADRARASGFDNFNLDLMHGLPGQDVGAACADLQQAIDCQPTHLSWYQLTIEKNTEFYSRPPCIPVEDRLLEIQTHGEQLLAKSGYLNYEVSAYSKPGRRSQHNLNYWRFGDYIGIGAGAHGKISLSNGKIFRRAKTRLPKDYLNSKKAFCCTQQPIETDELSVEFMMNALRLNGGVEQALFSQRTGIAFTEIAAHVARLKQQGLLQPGERLATTALGSRYLDSVLEQFI